jgi:tartrate dehydratase beta subunit/fumarate hydratase class I family protein
MSNSLYFHALRQNIIRSDVSANADFTELGRGERIRRASATLDQPSFYRMIVGGLAAIIAASIVIVVIMI